jgi:hypothetical protein
MIGLECKKMYQNIQNLYQVRFVRAALLAIQTQIASTGCGISRRLSLWLKHLITLTRS